MEIALKSRTVINNSKFTADILVMYRDKSGEYGWEGIINDMTIKRYTIHIARIVQAHCMPDESILPVNNDKVGMGALQKITDDGLLGFADFATDSRAIAYAALLGFRGYKLIFESEFLENLSNIRFLFKKVNQSLYYLMNHVASEEGSLVKNAKDIMDAYDNLLSNYHFRSRILEEIVEQSKKVISLDFSRPETMYKAKDILSDLKEFKAA